MREKNKRKLTKVRGYNPKTKGQSLVHTPTVKSRSVTNVTVTFEQQRKVEKMEETQPRERFDKKTKKQEATFDKSQMN